MLKRCALLLLLTFLTGLPLYLRAQMPTEQGVLAYGETVSGIFHDETPAPHVWTFSGNPREMIQVQAQRIGGHVTPRIAVFAPDGSTLAPDSEYSDDFGQIVSMDTGLPQAGDYRIEVYGDQTSPGVIVPNEYTLTLTNTGIRRASTDEGLRPLPAVPTVPDLLSGSPAVDPALNVQLYGPAQTTQPDAISRRNAYIVSGGGRSFSLDNANPIVRGVRALSFTGGGVGFVTTQDAHFFTDQDITAFSYSQSIYTFALQNGQEFTTDFYRLASIQAVAGMVVVTTDSGQQIILSGQRFDLRRRGGVNGQGPNAEPVNELRIDNTMIATDLMLWHTLALLPGGMPELRVLYGDDTRFISSGPTLIELFQRGNALRPELDPAGTDVRYLDICLNAACGASSPELVTLAIDPSGMGDVVITGDRLTIDPLDGRSVTETLSTLRTMLIEVGGIRFQRRDNSYRLSLPDSTDIPTPSTLPAGNPLRAFGNLGATIFDYHPAVPFTEALYPFNRVSGNFHYPVVDFDIPGHSLHLYWARYYNSRAAQNTTPAYMHTAVEPYLFGAMGMRWRHSYQYELDITLAPHGVVQLILPDGSQHLFTLRDGVYRSASLLSWTVEQSGGITGTWAAHTAEGVVYTFDRAGRLHGVHAADGGVLVFSPAPRTLAAPLGLSSGFFITERYGRRLEVYTDTDNRVSLARDVQQREVRYRHNNLGELIQVDYPGVEEQAAYSYSSGQLVTADDARSRYHQQLELAYDIENRLVQFTVNARGRDGSSPLTTIITYDSGTTTERTSVGGADRIRLWRYDAELRLTGYESPVAGWTKTFQYDQNNGRLRGYGQYDGGIVTLIYDDWGYLTELRDPATYSYKLEYETLAGGRRALKKITWPTSGSDAPAHTFMYDDTGRLARIIQPVTLRPQLIEHVTTYEYDEAGRLITVTQPGPDGGGSVTQYEYDAFGYPTRISEGNDNGSRILHLQHDIAGRLRSVTDWRGYVMGIDWNEERDLVTGITRAGESIGYHYDDYGNLIEYTSPAATENYLYDGLNRVSAFTDALGRVTRYEYDEAGNLIYAALPDEANTGLHVYRYEYDGNDRLVRAELPGNRIYAYETLIERGTHTRVRITNPARELLTFTYNVLGRVISVTQADARGNVVYNYGLTYDPIGQLVSIEEKHDPAARQLLIRYDLRGRPVSSSIAGRAETRYATNAAGYIQSVTDPTGQVTNLVHDVWGRVIAAQQPDGELRLYTYDEAGNLTQHTDARGSVYEYVFDDFNRLTGRVDPLGNRTSYAYDTAGNLTQMTDARGSVSQATYNAVNQLTALIDPDGTRTTYEYDALDRLTRINAPRGVTVSLTYDQSDNIVARTITSSREMLYAYDSLRRLTSVTNALGHTVQYAYNNYDRVGRVINPLGNTDVYSWAGDGRLNTFTDADGRTYTYISDNLGRLVRVVGPAGQADFTYDDAGRLREIRFTSGAGSQTSTYRYEYDAMGRMVRFADPELPSGIWWQFDYDPNGSLTAVVTPDNRRTAYTYDAADRLISVTQPGGAVETFTYDGSGNITGYTAANGTVSEYAYDSKNRLTGRVDTTASGETRSYLYSYDESDNLERIVDPNGNETRYLFDEFGNVRRIQRILAAEHAVEYRYVYDAVNNLTSVQLPPLSPAQPNPVISMTYNALNQRVRYIDAASHVWAYNYDRAGNLTQISDPLGSAVGYAYDQANRLHRITYPNGAQIDLRYGVSGQQGLMEIPETLSGDITSRLRAVYGFDRNNNLVSIEYSPRETVRISRDALGRVREIETANRQRIAYTYNDAGQLVATSGPEGTIQREYDVMGRLTRISSGDQSIQYAYDGFGNLTQVTQDGHTTRYTYDSVGNLLISDDSRFGAVSYEYDALYRPVRITMPDSGFSVTYNDLGLRTAVVYDSGLTASYEYDPNGRITAIGYGGPDNQRLDRFTYQYDAAGNITRITRADQWKVLYGYDAHQQLIAERWLNPANEVTYAVTYSYDLAGNRTEAITRVGQQNPQRTVYYYNTLNQLVGEIRNASFDRVDRFTGEVLDSQSSQFNIRYEYDAAGNLTRMRYDTGGELALSYDSFNRLREARGTTYTGESVAVVIRYDVRGRIRSVDSGGEQYRMIYDAQQLTAIQHAGTGQTYRYHYTPWGELAWFDTPDGRLQPLYDALGSVRRYASADGNLFDGRAGLNFNAFGEQITPYGSDAAYDLVPHPHPLFAGQLYEPATGLYLLGVRAYMPQAGRFIQRDPVRHDPQNALYVYAYNRPGVYTDPYGAQPQPLFEAALAAAYPQGVVESMLPRIDLPDTQPPLSVHQRQGDENQRILRIAQMARHDINATVGLLAPGACDFYMLGLAPAPQHLREIAAADTGRAADLYTADGWLPLAEPDIHAPVDPYAVLDVVEQHLRQTQGIGLPLRHAGCAANPLPVPVSPLPSLTTGADRLLAFRELLSEISLYEPLSELISQWVQARDIDRAAAPATTRTTLLPDTLPPLPDPLAWLSEQTTEMALLMGLPDHTLRSGRTGPRMFDTAPPIFEYFIR